MNKMIRSYGAHQLSVVETLEWHKHERFGLTRPHQESVVGETPLSQCGQSDVKCGSII